MKCKKKKKKEYTKKKLNDGSKEALNVHHGGVPCRVLATQAQRRDKVLLLLSYGTK